MASTDRPLKGRSQPPTLTDLADSNDAATREAVYHHPDRPAAFIALLARAGVYAEASTEPGETWHDWNGALVGGTDDVIVRPAIPPDPTLPFADFAFLLGRGEFARSVVARHPSTPPDVLETLLEDPKPSVRIAAAKHPQLTPLAIAKAVEADADPALVRALAENPSFLPELFARLATSCHPDLREEAAKQSRDPVTLEALAADPSLGVTFEVARSLFAPPSALRRLAAHPSQHIRKLVAGNPNAPADVLEALARDADFYVPIEVAKNPSSPPAAFEALPQTKPISVEVAKNQQAPSAARARAIDLIVACDDWLLRSDLARAPSTPPPALARLAVDKTHRVREALASNPAAPDDLLRLLADDPDGRVRRAVGENRACPPDLVRRLAEDPDVNVRHGVAGSPHLREAGKGLARVGEPAAGLYCDADSRRCAPRKPPEAPCRSHNECADGSYCSGCKYDDPCTEGVCTALRGLDEACDPAANLYCQRGLYCNAASGRCAIARRAGEPCDGAESCPGTCIEGVCDGGLFEPYRRICTGVGVLGYWNGS